MNMDGKPTYQDFADTVTSLDPWSAKVKVSCFTHESIDPATASD
jgi:hypothetical protein